MDVRESGVRLMARLFNLVGLEERSLRLVAQSRPDDHWPLLGLYNFYKTREKRIPEDLEELILKARIKTMITPGELVGRLKEIYDLSGRDLSDIELKEILTPNQTHDKVFYFFALPKSASRTMMRMLISAQGRSGIPDSLPPYAHGNPGLAATMELRFEYLSACRGGWFHSHAASTAPTLHVLDRLDIRHVITVRHPADHIAALYCHLRGLYPDDKKIVPPMETKASLKNNLDGLRLRQRWHNVIHPVNETFFSSDVAVEDAIDHLINDGYLVSALKWMADWATFANRSLACFVRYEDLMRDGEAVLTDAYRFLRKSEPVVPIRMPEPETSADRAIYPRGYSGKVGIHAQYFSQKNIDDYNKVVRSFLEATRTSRKFLEVYPDALI